MGMLIDTRKLTVAEFMDIDFDDSERNVHLYELINGEIVKKSAPAPRHQSISFKLGLQLGNHVKQQQMGEMFAAPIDVFLDDYNSVQPDLLFMPNERSDIVTNDGIVGPPALVVEIISPTSGYRDRVTKKNLYERHGIAEYWLVDPLEELVEIYSLTDGRYVLLSAASATEGTLTSAVLPGIAVTVSALF